jgi:hypothetical protein
MMTAPPDIVLKLPNSANLKLATTMIVHGQVILSRMLVLVILYAVFLTGHQASFTMKV